MYEPQIEQQQEWQQQQMYPSSEMSHDGINNNDTVL
jgi:hypothetical protein